MKILGIAKFCSLALLLLPTQPQAETLRYGTGFPARALWAADGVFPILEQMSAKSTDGLSFTVLGGGQVVKMGGEIDGMNDGLIDAAYFLVQFSPNELPAASLPAEMLAYSNDAMAAAGAFVEIIMVACEECKEDFERNGIIPIDAAAPTPYVMMCAKELNDSSEVNGLRTRMANPAVGRWAEKLGMSASVIPGPEVSQAMQFGRIDCAIALRSWLQSYALYDVVKTIIDFPQGSPNGAIGLAVSRNAWDKLTEADRRIIISMAPDLHVNHVMKGYIEPDGPVMEEALAKGIKIIDGGEYFSKRWDEFRMTERAEIIEVAKQRGLKEPEKSADLMINIFERWHTTLKAEFGNDPEKYREVLVREVYSKVSLK